MNTFLIWLIPTVCASLRYNAHRCPCKWMYPSEKETRIEWCAPPIPPPVTPTLPVAYAGGPTSALGVLALLRQDNPAMTWWGMVGSPFRKQNQPCTSCRSCRTRHQAYPTPPPNVQLGCHARIRDHYKRRWEWSRQGKKQRPSHVVTMRPPIVKTSLDFCISRLLQVQLEPVLCGLHIR